MKHNQPRYCQFHRSNGNHFSSECNRNPANMKNSRMAELDQRKTTSRNKDKPTIRRRKHLHAGKPEASKIFKKISTLFSSSEDEKEYTPELITLEEEEQKEIDAMAKDSEDENPDPAENGEKNEDKEPRSSSPYNFEDKVSENDQSASDVEDKSKSQASGTFPKHEWMIQRIKILKQEVKIAEMKTEIIKHEINNSRDLRQLQKKYKINL